MSNLFQLLTRLAQQPAVLVSVVGSRGSVPRERGAWMAVFADDLLGTIGGGHLEYQACVQARALLAQHAGAASLPSGLPSTQALTRTQTPTWTQTFSLGPNLGQCCGGEVQLQFEPVQAADAPLLRQRLTAPDPALALFGGGHVGRALVHVLAPLGWPLHWIDSRDEVFPQGLDDTVVCEHSDPVHAAVPRLAAGSRVLIMSFSHAEDLDIVAACLERQRRQADLPYLGLIGSKTKWARFQSRLRARGFLDAELAHVTCPIGIPGIASKQPEAIAIAVAAQLLLAQNGGRPA